MDIKKWLNKTIKPDIGYNQPRSDNEPTDSFRSTWKTLWKKLKREKKKMMVRSTSMHVHHVPYDEHTYMQNFDQGMQWNDLEPDILSRSFSVRFTDRRSSVV
ncbi:hypothetical protein R6Q57_008133 [Mikania cordata]